MFLGSLFVSPPARLVFADTQAETGAGARQSRQTIAVKSGHRLGPITVSVYDAYGKQYSVPSTETLVIRLSSSPDAVVGAGITANLTNAAASAPITWLGGDLVKTFIDASNVTFSDLRAYSVGIGTFNFSFVRGKGSYEGAEWDDLFGSALLTVRVDPCSGDEQLDANTECVAAPLSASSSGTSSGLVAAAVVPVILVSVAFVVTCRWWYQRLRKAKSKATHKEFLKHVMSKKEHLLALEIPAETVELLDVIGSGEFGLVHKAQVGNRLSHSALVRVALCSVASVAADLNSVCLSVCLSFSFSPSLPLSVSLSLSLFLSLSFSLSLSLSLFLS
eukprot:Opistho-2@57232